MFHRSLSIKINKVHCDILPEILNEPFFLSHADQCYLTDRPQFLIPNVKIVNHGFESVKYLGFKIQETIPSQLNEIDYLKNFQ